MDEKDELRKWHLIRIEINGKIIEIENPSISENFSGELIIIGLKYELSQDEKRKHVSNSNEIKYSEVSKIEYLVSEKDHEEGEGIITKIIVFSIVVIIFLQLTFCGKW